VQIALRLRAFGGPENFELTDVPKPAIRPGMALIRVDATSVNQIDVRIRSGQVPIGPDLPTILGADVAGTIEEVGAGVLDFAPGDEVYGCAGAPRGFRSPINSNSTPTFWLSSRAEPGNQHRRIFDAVARTAPSLKRDRRYHRPGRSLIRRSNHQKGTASSKPRRKTPS
jgi:hypothetical protein